MELHTETLIVNLFGVPGAGKSTGAAQIFASLKKAGVNAELVTEFAKDKVWEENPAVFKNQAYIFGKQSFKISRCTGKVDVIVTDSPLPLSIFYNEDPLLTENFNRTVMDVFNGYENINYLLLRTKPYNPKGRFQSEEESDALKQPLVDLLKNRNIAYKEVNGDDTGYETIVSEILKLLEIKSHGNNWIPCSELLPIKYGKYLCQCKYRDEMAVCIYRKSDEYVDHDYWDWICRNGFPNVIAWKPLPEKYKG